MAETPLLRLVVLLHLLLGRRDRLELAIGAQLVDQPILQRGAALLVTEPAPVLLRRLKARLPELFLVVDFGLEVVSHFPDLLLDPVGDLLIGHRDRGVPKRLLDQQLFVDDRRDDLAPRGVQPFLRLRELHSLRLATEELLVHLGGEHGPVADHRDDVVHYHGGVAAQGPRAVLGLDWLRDNAAERQRGEPEDRGSRIHVGPPLHRFALSFAAAGAASGRCGGGCLRGTGTGRQGTRNRRPARRRPHGALRRRPSRTCARCSWASSTARFTPASLIRYGSRPPGAGSPTRKEAA